MMFEVEQIIMLFSVGIVCLLLLWWLQYQRQKIRTLELSQTIQELGEDVLAQKQLIDVHMQDLTKQMVSHASLNECVRQTEKQVEILTTQLSEKVTIINTLNAKVSDYKANVSKLETRLEEERKSSIEKLQLLDEAKSKLGNEFKVLANQIFEEKGKVFNQQNRSSLDEVLKPMREQLGDFRKRVDEIHTDDS
ncbi:MAG: DNA recombination protein RmuC, partial [Mariprofundaceae bacterium]|nr:DNA recombination protein RmuC [Mariprofundaceae bacterium]